MIDPATIAQLANLRRQIDLAHQSCDQTLDAMSLAGRQAGQLAAATPFLSDCAKELEALAGVCRRAAAQAGTPRLAD